MSTKRSTKTCIRLRKALYYEAHEGIMQLLKQKLNKRGKVMNNSFANRVEKFDNSNKNGRKKLSEKRDNKKLNKTVRGKRDADEFDGF